MFRAVFPVLVLLGCDVQPPVSDGPVESTFDADDEGWGVVGDAQGGQITPDWLDSGGNPGGHVTADDDTVGGVWYWSAPRKFLGDKRGFSGGQLLFDLYQSDTSSAFDDVDVVLNGTQGSVTLSLADPPSTDWTPYSVQIDAAEGWLNDAGEPADQADIDAALEDLLELLIRGEYRDGADTGGLDNVVFKP